MTASLNAPNERANELFRGEKLGYLRTESIESPIHLQEATASISFYRIVLNTLFFLILHLLFITIFYVVGIPAAVVMVMEKHKADFMSNPTLENIVAVDVWARNAVDSMLPVINGKHFINV